MRAVQHGRYWRIPRSELERVGLIAATDAGEVAGSEGRATDGTPMVIALEREKAERQRLVRELARLRPLVAKIERVTDELEAARTAREAAEAKTEQAARDAAALRAWQQELIRAGVLRRERLIRQHRDATAAAATASAPSPPRSEGTEGTRPAESTQSARTVLSLRLAALTADIEHQLRHPERIAATGALLGASRALLSRFVRTRR